MHACRLFAEDWPGVQPWPSALLGTVRPPARSRFSGCRRGRAGQPIPREEIGGPAETTTSTKLYECGPKPVGTVGERRDSRYKTAEGTPALDLPVRGSC